MSEQQQLLVVDDDHTIRDLISQFLQQHGFIVSQAADGQAMRDALQERSFDLIILDVMMPGEDGLSLCRSLRQHSQTPIIMVTAVSHEIERILALEWGADDYLSKPFHLRELLARVRAVLRRTTSCAFTPIEHADTSYLYQFDGWLLDATTRQLYSPDQLEVTLSSGEYELLYVFLCAPQKVLSREYLLEATKSRSALPYDRSVDIQISRLRHKIEVNQKHPRIIKTVRGGGYVLAIDVIKQAKVPCGH